MGAAFKNWAYLLASMTHISFKLGKTRQNSVTIKGLGQSVSADSHRCAPPNGEDGTIIMTSAATPFATLCPGCFADKGHHTSTCPHCGYDESLKRGPLVLPHRTLLHNGQYLVGKVLGKPGGFGITYLAFDTRLETNVAIKEYLPRDLAGRDGDRATISAHSADDAEHFRYGLTQFLQEARTLARFDHANIVRVRNFFEENGTGYLVMDYYDGITLTDYLARQPQGKLPEQTAVDILMPILDGLREVHAKNFLHRDIKPQNIYLTTGNRAILLDFGAARQAMSERSRSLSVVLSEGYAPYEQYHRRGEQGPWTDIYASAAVLYHMVAGDAPPPATERMGKDELDIGALGLSVSLANALRSGLAVNHQNRPQTMTEFQSLLMVGRTSATTETIAPKPASVVPLKAASARADAPASSNTAIGRKKLWAVLALCVVLVAGFLFVSTRKDPAAIYAEGLAAYQNKDYAGALAKLRPLAEQGDAVAQYNLGVMYGNGQGVAKNQAESVNWYRKAAEQGMAEAQYNLGVMYRDGQGVQKNEAESVNWFLRAAKQGMAEAQYNLGVMYDEGQGVQKNETEAVNWYRKAAEQGYSRAQHNLGVMYDEGQGVRKNETEAVNWYRKAAEQGDVRAQTSLGVMYANGQGVQQDEVEAVNWYRRAAEQGFAGAQNNLGHMYNQGQGVQKNEAEAVNWYRKAAEQGFVSAQFNLGNMYYQGQGVQKNEAEAVNWYRKAAEQGYVKAQTNLGWMYSQGQGVQQDEVEAVSWFRKAAAQGHAKARAELQRRGLQ